MSVRLVVSIQSLALGSTATNILTMWLTTNGVVICVVIHRVCNFFVMIDNKLSLVIGLFTKTVLCVCT